MIWKSYSLKYVKFFNPKKSNHVNEPYIEHEQTLYYKKKVN